jgi:hypothetical protein
MEALTIDQIKKRIFPAAVYDLPVLSKQDEEKEKDKLATFIFDTGIANRSDYVWNFHVTPYFEFKNLNV